MTQNVVSYLNVRESERANKMREAHNTAVHNENVRHNLALEAISAEQNRIQDAAQREIARHNAEAEKAAHTQAAASSQQAAAALRNALTQQMVQQETARHNAMTEYISREYNLGSLSESHRQASAALINAAANQSMLEISRDINRIREAELSETTRRNTQNYDLGIRSANLGRDQLLLDTQRNTWQRQQGWANVAIGAVDTGADVYRAITETRGRIAGTLIRALLN